MKKKNEKAEKVLRQIQQLELRLKEKNESLDEESERLNQKYTMMKKYEETYYSHKYRDDDLGCI